MMNNRGWIKIFEAVIAVLLIASVLLIVLGQSSVKKDESSLKIYKAEVSILREIQLNSSLREDILGIESLPVKWDDFNSTGLGDVRNKIILKTPDYLNCTAMVCEMNDTCILNEDSGREVYVQSIAITASLEKYSPRQLKLFCETEKEPCIAEPLVITCETYVCGDTTNNCGQKISCGSCSTNGICSEGACYPETNYADCDNDLTNGYECSTSGNNLCYEGRCCTPTDVCSVMEYTCGSYDDNCGGTIDCGSCIDDCNDCISGHCQKSCSYCGTGECTYLSGCYDNKLGSCLTCDYNEYWYDNVDKNCDGSTGIVYKQATIPACASTNDLQYSVKGISENAYQIYGHLKGKTLTWDTTFTPEDSYYTNPIHFVGSYTFPTTTPPVGRSSLRFHVGGCIVIEIYGNQIRLFHGGFLSPSCYTSLNTDTNAASWKDNTWYDQAYMHFSGYGAPHLESSFLLYPTYLVQSKTTSNFGLYYIYKSSDGAWHGWYSHFDSSTSPQRGTLKAGSYITLT